MLHTWSWDPPPPSLINLKDDELDHTAAVWCMVKDRCDHDKGFLEASNLNRKGLNASASASSSPRSSRSDLDEEMGEIIEDSIDNDDGDTDVEEVVLTIHPEDQEDDIISSSQKPVVQFFESKKRTGMLKLKKK